MGASKNMPHDLVKTKENLNNVPGVVKLTEFEQDLFRCLIWRLQYKLDRNNDKKSLPVFDELIPIGDRTVRLTRDDLMKLLPHRFYHDEKQFYSLASRAAKNIIKTNFKNLWDNNNNKDDVFINMFSMLRVRSLDDKQKRLDFIEFTLNQEFCWVIYNLSEKYTSIYIDNFTAIKGRYAKALYVQLRDWRTKGFWHVEYERFRFLMSVPKSYYWSDVERRILTPAINELNSILIDPSSSTPERPLFTKLYYRINTMPAHGRTGKKVESLDFFFTPERKDGNLIDKAPVAQKSQSQKKIPTAQAQKVQDGAPQAENYRSAPAQDTAQNEPQRFNNHDSHGWNEDEINSLANDVPAPSSAPLTALLKDLGIRNFDQLAAAIQSLKSAKK